MVFFPFYANFTIRKCEEQSVFLIFHTGFNRKWYPHISSWHYIDRICNPAYQLMHRSHLETTQLCTLGLSDELVPH